MAKKKITRVDYGEFLLVSQINYTLTYYAEHKENMSHDQLNRYLAEEKFTPALIWEHVAKEIELSPNGRIIFDDTVLDKRYSEKIETTQVQYSGNEHRVIRGIGVVNCVYYNPDVNKFWIIDYRIYDKKADGKSKIDHLLEMFNNIVHQKKLPFCSILMDTWYASAKVMLTINSAKKVFYCPIPKSRNVSLVDRKHKYTAVENFKWDSESKLSGQTVHLAKMNHKFHVRLFRITNKNRTDFIVTNDLSQNSADLVQDEYKMRWKVEEFHREIKQTTGIESCQCRKQRIQRNHIAISILVWSRMKNLAYQLGTTIYQIKQGLLGNYLRSLLRSPAISMSGFA